MFHDKSQKLTKLWKWCQLMFFLIRDHRLGRGVSVPEGGDHHEGLQPPQCSLPVGYLPSARGLTPGGSSVYETRRPAQLHPWWGTCKGTHKSMLQISAPELYFKTHFTSLITCNKVTLIDSSRTQQLRTWWALGCRWPEGWSIWPARSLSTETWLPGTACELAFTHLASSDGVLNIKRHNTAENRSKYRWEETESKRAIKNRISTL